MTVLAEELGVALELVERCGKIALTIQAGGDETMATADKPDNQGPVTRADLLVESEIVRTLREAFPRDAILAEEAARDGAWASHERVWMIDPIDGTRDFAEGSQSWAIHIGLTIDGVPSLGVVHEPGAHRTSWAVVHAGERLGWTRINGFSPTALHGIGQIRDPRWVLLTSRSHRSPRLDPLAERLGISREQQLRTGSTGVKISMIARGEARIYAHPSLGTKLWDSCAPHVVLRASGGTLTDMTGEPLRYDGSTLDNAQGLLATDPGTDHAAIVDKLRPLVTEWFG